MSAPFTGFSTQRKQAIPLPIECFTEILAEIQDLAEFKLLLTVFRLVATRKDLPKDKPRLVSWDELRQDESLQQGLTVLGGEISSAERLDRALERAVARGTLLHLVVQRRGHSESWYLLHTAANRRLVEQLEGAPAGLLEGTPLSDASMVEARRPNIFALYEQNIGMLTPILAEELEEASGRYPADWIEEAFREAVAYNKRSWRYVQAILERWAREGRGERPGRESIDLEKYTRGEYADLFGEG